MTTFRNDSVVPVELSATRHFFAGARLVPSVRAGVRYVNEGPGFVLVRSGSNFVDRTSAQAGAGVRLRLTPRTSLRAVVARLLREDELPFDPRTRGAVGFSWTF